MKTGYLSAGAIGLCAAITGCNGYSSNGKTYNPPVSQQVVSISVTPTSASIAAGDTQQFKATAKNSSGGTVSGASITWHSSDTSVATIDSTGLATGVAAGTATITATTMTPGGGLYSNGTTQTITSNKAMLTVAAADQVMGMAVTASVEPTQSLVLVHDTNGNMQAAMTDAAGRFVLSVGGMQPPFLVQARDSLGRHTFSIATAAGVVNVNPLTDFLVRTWFQANGRNIESDFTEARAPESLGSQTLAAMNASLKQALGLTLQHFNFFTSPYTADGSGYDGLLHQLSVTATAAGLVIRNRASGRRVEAVMGAGGAVTLRVIPVNGAQASEIGMLAGR